MAHVSNEVNDVVAPRAWFEAARALDLLGRRAGQRYVVVVRKLRGLVGPFEVGQPITPEDVLERIAQATGTELTWTGDVAVFQAARPAPAPHDRTSDDPHARRRAAFRLGESQRLDAVQPLMSALSDADPSVRRAALLALDSLEGGFRLNQWAGRLSLFELPEVERDTETLMWLVEEAAEPGGLEWTAAASILARAREGELPRSIWWKAWNRCQGAIMPTVWAAGRCGDPDMRRMLDTTFRNPTTNVAADRFGVAAAMGRLGVVQTLRAYAFAKGDGPPGPEMRCAAAYGLGFARGARSDRRPGPGPVETLTDMLGDPDSRVREVAALSLGRLETDASVAPLAAALADESLDAGLRAASARALGGSSGRQAVPALIAATQSATPAVRAAVADALGSSGGALALQALEPLLRDDSRGVAAATGRALAALGSGHMLPKLTAALTNGSSDLELRIAIAIGLGQSRMPESAAALSEVALDGAADRRLREYAARSLAMLADRAGQDTLRKLIESAPPVRLTLLPLRYLDLGDPDETVKYLKWWATHGGARHEQSTAYERIGEIGTAEGTRFLAGGYETFDNYTRWTCIWPLVQNETGRVRRALVELLTDSRRRTQRTNAAIALGGPGSADAAPADPDAVDALMAALKDSAESVRVAAADSLGLLGDPRAASALIEALEGDESVRVAHHALRALRTRELASLPEVRAAVDRVRKTRRDCGAPGAPPLMDQPANSFVLRCFNRDYDDLSLPNLTYESSLCSDDAGRIIQWGSHGRRYDSPQLNLTWLFDAKTGTWRRPTPKQEPPGICMTRGTVCDTVRGLVMATRVPTGMGGHGYVMYLRKFTAFSVPWVYDIAAGEWYAMRPAPHPGSAGYVASCFDWRNDAMLLMKNGMQVYDTHANRWTSLAPEPQPDGMGSCPPNAYDPVAGRLVVVGADERGGATTWAYDLAANGWTDLAPANPPPALGNAPMVYDSANDVMLAFQRAGGGTRVHVYDPRENRWESLAATNPSPDYALFDAAYDPVSNVTVLCGGEDASCSGEPGVRETWTYRHKAGGGGCAANTPFRLELDLTKDGAVSLSWEAPPVDARGYAVYRGTGEHPWTAAFEKLNDEPVTATTFEETETPGPEAHYYRVVALGGDGAPAAYSTLARTQPLPVREVDAARAADGAVTVTWHPSAGPGVVGYNIYRAPVEAIDFWTQHFDPANVAGDFVRLNDEPIADTCFADEPDQAADRATETSWAPLHAYVVRAVNARGTESGPSPVTLSIPGPPGPIQVVPQEDGSQLVICGASGSAPLTGHQLYRLDCYRGDAVYRMRGAPHPGTVFVDDQTWPEGDRRAYYVLPVDELGQLGVPSSPGWGKHMP